MIVARNGDVILAAHFQPRDCRTGRSSSNDAAACVWISHDRRHFHLAGGDVNLQMGDDVDLAQTKSGTLIESAMTFVERLNGVLGTTVSRSSDHGQTWTESFDANSEVLNDRPFALATSRGDAFLTYDAIPGGLRAVKSTDDGRTFGSPIQIVQPPAGGLVDANGGPTEDHARRELIVPYVYASDPSCTSGASGCLNEIALARSSLDGTRWTQESVARTSGSGTTGVTGSAADAKGREYIAIGTAAGGSAFTTANRDAHVFVTTSPRPGVWTKPKRIDPPGTSAMLPWVAATGNGHVVVAYYGSPFPDAQATDRPWYVYVARSNDAGRTFSISKVSALAYFGSGAAHQTVLWDLLALTIDRNDVAHVAWTSAVSNGVTQIMYAHEVR
jgi:hypothetical protein